MYWLRCLVRLSLLGFGPGTGPGLTGGGGSKGTINWPETAHSAIWPRAKMSKFGP